MTERCSSLEARYQTFEVSSSVFCVTEVVQIICGMRSGQSSECISNIKLRRVAIQGFQCRVPRETYEYEWNGRLDTGGIEQQKNGVVRRRRSMGSGSREEKA